MKPVTFTKSGLDLLAIQMKWTLFSLGIFTLINVIQKFFSSNVDSFYYAGYISSNIYMFVIGIIAISFLTHYVENGITRKNYFYGNVIASIGLSIIIPIILYVVNLVELFIINRFTAFTSDNISINSIMVDVVNDVDGNIIAEIVLSMILSPFISLETNVILSLSLFSINIFVFYIIGWLIGAAFQRLGVIGGLLFIIIGVTLIGVKDSMLRLALDTPLFKSFSFLEVVPEALALPVIFLVIVATLIMIRLLTKRTSISM
ncbi:hypothetical protein [Paraliobacillus sp. JSM ZJ581]|uniref:hypothetical protein n=1 Tax=Paraliobacillus sp. JSM ZJ581 TaxID=3342118 RepID=UPI0035A8AFE3